MKILEENDGTVSNIEVLAHLQDMRKRYTAQAEASSNATSPLKSSNLETVMKELTDYLTSAPSPLEPDFPAPMSQISDLLAATADFDLTKEETLQILNLRPDSAAVLDAIINDLETRFSEERQVELLRRIRGVMGGGFRTPPLEGEEEIETSREQVMVDVEDDTSATKDR